MRQERKIGGQESRNVWDIRKNPKKAVVIAAQIMILSSISLEELNRFLFIILKRGGVMGRRFGRE